MFHIANDALSFVPSVSFNHLLYILHICILVLWVFSLALRMYVMQSMLLVLMHKPRTLKYWNSRSSMNVYEFVWCNYKTKDIVFHFVWITLESMRILLYNRKYFFDEQNYEKNKCTDSQSQYWDWKEIEQYMQNTRHLVHKHFALFSPLCIPSFPPWNVSMK